MEEERRKPKGNNDHLELVKAAAWAWYQRGFKPEFKPKPESDFSRSKIRSQKPTRYRVEAMGKIEQEISISRPLLQLSKSDVTSLLDSYEIERISRELDYYIEASRLFSDSAGDLGRLEIPSSSPERGRAGDLGRRRIASSSPEEKKKRKKKKKGKGFLVWRGVVCGSRDDVARSGGCGRRPEKAVALAGVRGCVPRATHA